MEEREFLNAAIETIAQRFRSGNRIPVDKAQVPAEEWYALVAALASAPAAEPSTGNWISADDYHRNVRALDVALNGIEGAARRPLLIDVLSQVKAEVSRRGAPLLAPTAQPATQTGSGEGMRCADCGGCSFEPTPPT